MAMTLRERISYLLYPETRKTLDSILEQGLHLPLEVQQARLAETSGDLFKKVVTRSDYITPLTTYTDAERTQDIEYAYYLYYSNPTISGIVDRYLDFGLGRSVSVVSTTNEDVIEEVMQSIRNSSVFGIKHFRDSGVDFICEGELLYVLWYDTTTKLTTISRLPTRKVEIIWADPLTKKIPQFYLLNTTEGIILYRDWRTQDDVLQAYISENEVIYANDLENNVLGLEHIVVWSVGGKRHVTSGRGMPLLSVVFKNSEYLSQFDDQRFAVSSESAKYTESYTIQGGQRSLEDFINREEASVPVFGSGFASNEAVNREWNNNPTGANSERFNQHVWLQGISSATSLNGAILGVPSMLSNRSVLDKLMEIFVEYIESFQNTIADTIKDVLKLVVLISENPTVFGTPQLFEPNDNLLDITVSLETPISIDLDLAMKFISQGYANYDQLDEISQLKLRELVDVVFMKFGVTW